MHELSVAREIISAVELEVSKRGLTDVSEIKLKIGALAGVAPESLNFAFTASTIGTAFEKTKLTIEWIYVKGKCKTCGENFVIDDLIFLCPNCDSTDIEILQGEELDIEYLITG
jgi:hydrogenase nickel incorporation protein HypA/HybF